MRSLSILALSIFSLVVTALSVSKPGQAQTYTILHSFTGGLSGADPVGLAMDAAGNLYGATYGGGNSGTICGAIGCGTVFKLAHKNGSWTFNSLYAFTGGSDGASPFAGLAIGPNGIVYGTANSGGGGGGGCGTSGCGTVYSLQPTPSFPRNALAPWLETTLHKFQGPPNDGNNPGLATPLIDPAGNLYGTASGGTAGQGVVFELTRSSGVWTESIIHNFSGSDGSQPLAGLTIDPTGNLYGTTAYGGAYNYGAVYELTRSGSGWVEQVLYSFTGASDGFGPSYPLTFDRSGNLYGTTAYGGIGDWGTVFQLVPSEGGWSLNTLYSFSGNGPIRPGGTLAIDALGNVYGTTGEGGAYGYGAVYKLTHSSGSWVYTAVYDFCPNGYPCTNGDGPLGVILDASGNLFGQAGGGPSNDGVVYEITP